MNSTVDTHIATKAPLSRGWNLERQTRAVVGTMILAASVLGLLVSPSFLYFTGFVGIALITAGFTDLCPMTLVLAKLPWNRGKALPTQNCCK